MTIKNRQIKTSFIIAACSLLAVAIVFVLSITVLSSKNSKGQKRPGGMRDSSSSVVSVKTSVVEIQTLHGYVKTNGEVESQNSVSVFPDMGGKVISTNVLLGSSVKKNEVIAYVDPSEPGTNYRSSPVYAPISGSVISTPLKNGTKVTTSTAIAIIGDINNLQITANVPERYVSLLKTGLKAEVSLEAYPNVVFNATVSRVSPVVDSTSRTKEIILTFDKEDERINAGMFAKVKLYTKDYDGKVVMPSSALVQNGDDFFAYVVQADSTVLKVAVKKGEEVDGLVQILEGVKAGDKVVIQGMTSLGSGSKVKEISQN
ncbi:efflux RND transporter periplasmic adaptor subunit [Treponema pectinovorum]|uniref:efflux RND transporter periplasmic adaptor subunit n=1 Tax=Treponema pectinovorum TaxID=164 RepID=UPI0011F2702F|nr:efflux RND transporter periplasmic adaptor subunit [Treponema pectinovorum]